MTRRLCASVVVLIGALAGGVPALAQDITGIPGQRLVTRYQCPGDAVGNLGSFDCTFTKEMRAEHLVTSAVTDQAIVGAVMAGLLAHARNSPPEWGRNWDGLGRRVLSRYERKVVGATTEWAVGSLMRTDPRHVSYASDPLLASHKGGVWARVGHALADVGTVRMSHVEAKGRRLPNVPLFAGVLANGFTGRFWYPERERTVKASLMRAVGPLETALMSSFYSEFSPEVARLIGSIFKRGPKRVPASGTGGH